MALRMPCLRALRVRLLRCLPPLSWFPGHRPAQLAACFGPAKDAHIRAEFSQNGPGGDHADAGNAAKPGNRFQVHAGSDTLFQPEDLAFDKIQILHQFAQHEPVMIGDSPTQGQPEFGNLRKEAPFGRSARKLGLSTPSRMPE